MTESLLFLTGHLAVDNLQRELAQMKPEFQYRVENIGVKVAALMSTAIVSRRLENIDGIHRVILPGLFNGELDSLTEQFGVPFERGPKDLRDLPEFFGAARRDADLSDYQINIFAELVDAPNQTIDEILREARQNRNDGANVVDLGCLPGKKFPHLEETVQALKADDFLVSIDSMDNDELLRGGRAGADYLLSLHQGNLWIAEECSAIPVLIPQDGELSTLYSAIDSLSTQKLDFIADPILDPFPFGLTQSISRYVELRHRYPECEILMGTGNLTELMDAGTGGITAVLLSIMTELEIRALLTTQVSTHACRAIREADLARRLLHAANVDKQLPRRYDSGLMGLHERKPFAYSSSEIEALSTSIRDRNYRVQVSEDGIHLFNKQGHTVATDPFDLFDNIDVQGDLSHMFYLGVELARAQIAWQLGKRYLQDNELEWGVARRDLEPVVPDQRVSDNNESDKTGSDIT